MDPAPWRKVTRAYIRTNHKKHGRLLGSVLSREWILTLECGHERTRQVVVPLGKEPFWKRAADQSDWLIGAGLIIGARGIRDMVRLSYFHF